MHFDILSSLKQINKDVGVFGEISLIPRSPILLENGASQTLSTYALFGIYLLVEKNPDWNVPLEVYEGELLYVGKTNTNVHERIKSHFGLANMRSTFENHRWNSVPSISSDLKIKLGSGSVVLYCVDVRCEHTQCKDVALNILPEMVEKQLLLLFALKFGRLPYLNLQF